MVKLLLARVAQVDVINDENGSSALKVACGGGHYEIARLLLEKGAEIDMLDVESLPTHISCAINCRHFDVARLLREKCAAIGWDTFLTWVMEQGQYKVVRVFMENCSQKDLDLLFACKHGLHEAVRQLLAKKNMRDKLGRCAVMLASKYGHFEVVKLLIEKGAQVDTNVSALLSTLLSSLFLITDPDKMHSIVCGPTHASHVEYFKVVELLIEKGAQINLKDAGGCQTLLWLACIGGNLQISEEILEVYPWVD